MNAPSFRAVEAFTGDVASPVLGILATAEHIHEGLSELDRLRRDNEMLRRQLDALLESDRGELLTRNEELSEELAFVRELLAAKVAECAELTRERGRAIGAMTVRSTLRAFGWLVSELVPAQAVRAARARDYDSAASAGPVDEGPSYQIAKRREDMAPRIVKCINGFLQR